MAEEVNPVTQRGDRITKGSSGNPGGKPIGSRNRLQADFLTALADDFALHGAAVIASCRESKPADYLRIVASLMPKEVEIARPLDDLTDDQLAAAIAVVRAMIASGDSDRSPTL